MDRVSISERSPETAALLIPCLHLDVTAHQDGAGSGVGPVVHGWGRTGRAWSGTATRRPGPDQRRCQFGVMITLRAEFAAALWNTSYASSI
jgi:hypothetical protein